MKHLLVCALWIVSLAANAADTRIKSWKTLTNANGYTFTYPDCWVVKTDNPDELEDPVTKAHDIAIAETKSCSRPLLDDPQPNVIGISAGRDKVPLKKQLSEMLAKASSNSKSDTFFKQIKTGLGEGYLYVDLFNEPGYVWIRWQMRLFCPKSVIFVTGPAIKNPDKAYFDRFKTGDSALPEPEKTIFESIRCTDSKK